MHTLNTLLAFGWEPEMKGITVVLIAVVVLCGGTYLILATNLGARLGLLVATAGLMGWMTSMGAIWWAYGIGLQGDFPSWQAREIINDGDTSGSQFDIVQDMGDPAAVPEGSHGKRCDSLLAPVDQGWVRLATDDAGYGQAAAAADDILVNQAEVFAAGEYQVTNVFDNGGQRFPICFTVDTADINLKFGEWTFDYVAFIHQAHYSLVEVRPLVPQRTEPGRPPPRPIIDETQEPRYVLMERDRGQRRYPAALITIGSGIIFAILCVALHRRDQLLDRNLAAAQEPAKVPATVGS